MSWDVMIFRLRNTPRTIIWMTIVLLFVLASCKNGDTADFGPRSSPSSAAQAKPIPNQPASTSDLQAIITHDGAVTFRSFGGKWIGMDGDTDLTFLSNGAAHMFEYGVGVDEYRGAFSVDKNGVITATFPTFGHPWPTMVLRKDAQGLLLIPARSNAGIVVGNRGGYSIVPGQGSYWPFRPLGLEEARQVWDAIEKRKGKN